MKIFREEIDNNPPVTLLRLEGDLDATSFKELIAAGKQLYERGTRDLLLDFSSVEFMSSSGLVALHSVAMIMRGEAPPDLEHGWHAIHAMGEAVEKVDSFEKHVKLLNPSKRVMSIMEKTGFDQLFQIFPDRETALASFR